MPAHAQAPGIGNWFSLETGPFAGRLMCATLEEVQKADIGRKYGFGLCSSSAGPRETS